MVLIDNILAKIGHEDLQVSIAKRLVSSRKIQKLSRKQLSKESGVSYGSIRRFEETGKISLESLLKLARRLDSLKPFSDLFKFDEYSTMKELRKSK